MKKIFSLALVILLGCAFFASCAKEEGDSKEFSEGADKTKEGNAAQNGEAVDSMDEIPVADYGGREFCLFMCDEFFTRRDIIAEEITGEAINDAKYNRFKAIEERYDIEINLVYLGDAGKTYDYLSKSIATDDVRYDLTHVHASSIAQVVSAGILMDLKKLPYPDFGNPWWNKNLMESMTVKNVLLLCPSAIELPYSSATCFNKQMVQDNAMESPYELVRRGDWTMDKFYEICSGISKDLNGDGIFDKNDQYGFTTQNSWMLKSYLYAGNHTILVKDENDVPQLNKNYEHLSRIAEKMVNLFLQKNVTFMFDSNNEIDFPISMGSGRVFAIGLHLAEMSYLRGSDVDYGIVPLPKLDKEQENYPGISWGGFFAVPQNVSDPEMSGIIFEALSAESYRTILPIFKEQQLSIKFTRDEESIEMLDLIYDNMIYDMAPNYYTLNPYVNILAELYQRKSADVMSYMEKNETALQNALDKIIENYDAYID
ncbi:MAG: extracellular solute-binding protein [Oscillospiraceae bacterium]|nr:extracellular solute-binding protein [Oscillospiraceae bacterium]